MCTCLQYRIPDNLPWLRNRDQACHAELSELFWQDAAPGGGTLLPAWNPRGGSDSPSARHPHQGLPLYMIPRLPLPSAASAWGSLWVESHSDAVATWSWAWRSGKNGKLFEDIPARSFCRSAQPCPTPCQARQRVRPTGTPRHGSFDQPVPAGMTFLTDCYRPAPTRLAQFFNIDYTCTI
jgi:hypothetical protein